MKKIKVTGSKRKKIVDTGSKGKIIDVARVGKILGAEHIDIGELTLEECDGLEAIGCTVCIDSLDHGLILHYGARMLDQHNYSITDAVGYRVLDPEENPELLDTVKSDLGVDGYLVRFYGKKKE